MLRTVSMFPTYVQCQIPLFQTTKASPGELYYKVLATLSILTETLRNWCTRTHDHVINETSSDAEFSNDEKGQPYYAPPTSAGSGAFRNVDYSSERWSSSIFYFSSP